MAAFSRSDLADLNTFAAIVRHRSFTGAAIEIGVTTSALSHAVRRLETRLGARLLNRTSRSVAPTSLGLTLAERLAEGFDTIAAALDEAAGERAAAFGEIRLNVPSDAAMLLLRPALAEFVERFPRTRLSLAVEDRPVDIVAEGFDAGIRYGDTVPEDMVAMSLTPPLRWVTVASPAYVARFGRPASPGDLAQHRCLRLMLGNNAVFRWELGDGERLVRLDLPGTLTFNDTATTIDAAIQGLGIGYVLEERVRAHLADGRLELVLPDWASTGAGFAIYYPSRRQNHAALRHLVEIIRAGWQRRMDGAATASQG
ncbi:LysR family transcriptional regulator [Ancylobacter oerskovii]|uniref:LysR family transcriptional regulator n=1 Tax=Ancylobacter oerskovii TaxID=459519 RepID=A0ABW4Z205_9HYPH|nr:LysR family transcriptional regulator [Ancylobacter oerskovii]MBS7545018.1 LysR family transcriptional regulator [Ancylobacter oerskovii]